MRKLRWLFSVVVLLGWFAAPRGLAENPSFPFQPGDSLGLEQTEQLKPWLPPEFWSHRQYFFYEGMQMLIGPPHRDYSPPPVYQQATEKHKGSSSIGPDGTLQGYQAGQPFPTEGIDCSSDPQAGEKLIWNFMQRWQGFGARATFQYTYWDRGEKLNLNYQGTTSAFFLKHRPEPQFQDTSGDVFKKENRTVVIGFEVALPLEAKGTRTLTYRYADSLGPLETAKPEDTWIYLRDIRRIRKISQSQRSAAVAGTDFSFDDLFSFSGLPAQYTWKCLGDAEVLAPMNTKRLGFPYDLETAGSNGRPVVGFGPSGLSYASDRWELRHAVRLEMVPKDPTHPYSRKEIWLDRQTLHPLYSFAYDPSGALWKIIYHNHRWSEDDLGGVAARDWYPAWEGVPEPRDLRVVSEAIMNVQTGTGNRLDFWDSHGTMPRLGELRRLVDVQRLRRGR